MIPYKQADDLLTLLGPAALTLIVLLAAVWLVLVYLKRSGKSIGGPRRLKVLERLAQAVEDLRDQAVLDQQLPRVAQFNTT